MRRSIHIALRSIDFLMEPTGYCSTFIWSAELSAIRPSPPSARKISPLFEAVAILAGIITPTLTTGRNDGYRKVY